jgi:hypothetical protein
VGRGIAPPSFLGILPPEVDVDSMAHWFF